jgi:hypothetical protein
MELSRNNDREAFQECHDPSSKMHTLTRRSQMNTAVYSSVCCNHYKSA